MTDRIWWFNTYTKTILLSYFSVGMTYVVFRYLQLTINGGDAYLSTDWLINYKGGFNGRGLTGQIILYISDFFSQSPLFVVTIFQISMCLYVAFTIVSQVYAKNDYFSYLMLNSPAFLLSYFLDLGGAFRKELLGFFLLSVVIRAKSLERIWLLAFIIVVYVLFSFSWEASFVFLFPVIYLAKSKQNIDRYKLLKFALLSVEGIKICFLFFWKLQNNPVNQVLVCQSFVNRGLDSKLCGGRLDSINTYSGVSDVIEMHLTNGYYFYWLVFLVAIVPFLLSGFIQTHKSSFLLILLVTSPLWIFNLDYGRNIVIIVFILTFMYLGTANRLLIFKYPKMSTFEIIGNFSFIYLIFEFLFRIPHAGGLPEELNFGLIQRLFSLI